MIQHVGLWPTRVIWLLVPAAVGGALGGALDGRSEAVRLVAIVLAWAVWSAGLIALLVPRSIGLTGIRLVAPTVAAGAVWAALDSEVEVGLRALAVGISLIALLFAFLPSTGELLVDGSSYGDERRVLLRVPAALLFGPLPLAWAVVSGTVLAAPLLLAAQQWVAGVALALVGGVLSRFLIIRLHQLSRRWLVFVPAGIVVHDPLALGDPVLFPRRLVKRLGPAPLENPALDLTKGAVGLALELDTIEPVVLAPLRGREKLEAVGVTSILVTPTRPGHVLHLAKDRRLPVG